MRVITPFPNYSMGDAGRLNHESHRDYNRTDNHSSENKRSFDLIVHRSLSSASTALIATVRASVRAGVSWRVHVHFSRIPTVAAEYVGTGMVGPPIATRKGGSGYGDHRPSCSRRTRRGGDLSVWRVPPWISVGDYLRRSRPRVQIAKAAITGEYVAQMIARLECGVLAVPVHIAFSGIDYRAPRGIAIRLAG